MKLKGIVGAALLPLFVLATGRLAAQEKHPEHPKSEEKKPGLSKTDLAAAITSWADKEAARNGGWVPVEDPVQHKTLQLKLDKVHEERLAQVKPDVYFACADFVEKDGTKYDIDVFMEGKTKNDLRNTEVSVHKVNGIPRYTWFEENGMWKKKPAA
jgi:hypothetical protein